jgi:hypothetical protein
VTLFDVGHGLAPCVADGGGKADIKVHRSSHQFRRSRSESPVFRAQLGCDIDHLRRRGDGPQDQVSVIICQYETFGSAQKSAPPGSISRPRPGRTTAGGLRPQVQKAKLMVMK